MQHLDNASGLHEFVLGVGKSLNKHEEKMNGDRSAVLAEPFLDVPIMLRLQ
jgi:hypothetical protein